MIPTDPSSPLLPECPDCLQILPSGKENEQPIEDLLDIDTKVATCWTNATHPQVRPDSERARHSPIPSEDSQLEERCASCQNTLPAGKGDPKKQHMGSWETQVRDLNEYVYRLLSSIKETTSVHLSNAEEGEEQRTEAENWAERSRETVDLQKKKANELYGQGNANDYDTKQVEQISNLLKRADCYVSQVEGFSKLLQSKGPNNTIK